MRLVLLGGGPGHLKFIRNKAKNVNMDVEVILVSPASQVFYKPAFASVLSGKKTVYEAIIDLRKVSTLSGVTFIQADVENIDTEQKLIKFTDRASIQFDFLSIEGIDTPKKISTKNLDYIFQVHDFVHFFQQLKDLEKVLEENRHYPYHVAVVGAGNTGVHLALGLAERFRKFSSKITWEILEEKDVIMADYGVKIRKYQEKVLRKNDLLFHTGFVVQDVEDHVLRNAKDSKKFFDADLVFVAAGTQLPDWVKDSGFPLTAQGFMDTHNNYSLKQLPFVVASGLVAGERPDPKVVHGHVDILEKIVTSQSIEVKAKKAKPRKINLLHTNGKTVQMRWGFLSVKEKPYADAQQLLSLELDHLRGTKEQKLTQLAPQVEENIYVDKFKQRLLLDLTQEQLDRIFAEQLTEAQAVTYWCEKEYKDVFNDHYLSSYYTGLDILDQSYSKGGKPKYLRLYVSAPSTIKDVEILSQILIGAFRSCKENVELRIHLCSQAMNTVQFSLGVEAGEKEVLVPEPVAYIALTRPLGLYGLLSQQGKEGWEGQWLSGIWDQLVLTEKNLSPLVQKLHNHLSVFQLSENGFINDLVKNIGSEGWRVCLNLSQLPRWEGVDQILKRKPSDVLLQKNWKKGFRYWSGQGEQIPESQYLLWEPHLIRPAACLLVDPAYSKELSIEFKEKYNQKLIFIGYIERTESKEQTHYKLSDWLFENRNDVVQGVEVTAGPPPAVQGVSDEDAFNELVLSDDKGDITGGEVLI